MDQIMHTILSFGGEAAAAASAFSEKRRERMLKNLLVKIPPNS
jgi:hypothetical protein